MATSKKAKQDNHDPEVAIETAIVKTESFIERNAKTLYTIVIAIAVVVCGYFGWKYLIVQPRAEKATDMMFVAQQKYAEKEWQPALEGDGANAGFLEVIDTYGSTAPGNLARQYAGICYMKMDKIDEALDMLAGYKPGNNATAKIINAQNFGLRGDLLVQKEQYKDALHMFEKAAAAANNQLTTPNYLKKAGLVSEKLGDNVSALKFYKQIQEQYPMSMEGRDIAKYIGRVEQL